MVQASNSLVHALNAVHVHEFRFLTDFTILVETLVLTHRTRLLGSSIPAVNLVPRHGETWRPLKAQEERTKTSSKAKRLVRQVRFGMTLSHGGGTVGKVTGAKSEVGNEQAQLLGEKMRECLRLRCSHLWEFPT